VSADVTCVTDASLRERRFSSGPEHDRANRVGGAGPENPKSLEIDMSIAKPVKSVAEGMTVNEVVRAYPASVAVFNDHGIDACCGGAELVRLAAVRDGADPDVVLAELKRIIGESS
jgi:hypothetical protein